LILVFAALTPLNSASADGGGFPTSTNTPQPTSASVATTAPTGAVIIFPPTATFTVQAPALLQQEGGAIPEAQQVQVQPPAEEERSLTSVLCWPLGIVALILAFVGIYLLRGRIVRNPT